MPKKAKWDEIPCPACKEPVAHNATRCPHCQTEFTPQQLADRKTSFRGGVGCGAIVLVGLVGVLAMCSGGGEEAVPQQPATSAKADAVAVFQQVMTVAGPCDRAASRMAEAGQKQDLFDTIRGAEEMRDQCLSVPRDLRQIEVPESVGKSAYDQFSEGIKACEEGYLGRWSAAGDMITALDGGGKPSDLVEIEAGLEMSKAKLTYCSGLLVTAAMAAGATAKDLGVE